MRSLLGPLLNRSPVPLTTRRTGATFGNLLTGRGRQDDRLMQTQAAVSTVFGIVNRVTTATALADWHLYRTAASGLKEDRVEVTRHACIDLWAKPNPYMNRRRFMEAAQQHVELVGENALVTSHVMIGGTDVPVEMWPVRPDRITVTPDPYEFIAGYVYTSPDGERMPLLPNELLRIVMPNSRDPFRGLGPVESILVDTDNVKFSAEWNRMFFENSAEPGGVIQVPTTLNDIEFRRLQDQWEVDHKGVRKAHRVAILEADAKWQAAGYSHRDMQFTELRGLARDVILEAWGMPKSMLGIVEDVNRANAEASEYMFTKWIVTERLDRWRDLLNFELLPQYGRLGEGLEWDYDSPIPENSEQENQAITAKSTALALLTEKGYDAAELLAFFGWPEISYTKPEPKVVTVPADPGGAGNADDL